MNWHTCSKEEIYSITKSSANGLSSAEAESRLSIIGPNELHTKGRKPAWKLFLGQFQDFMIMVLMLAAGVSAIIGDLTDSIVIAIILILNALIGFVQEIRAQKAMESIKKLAVPEAKVIRDGHPQTIPASGLVPGDKVILRMGDAVPADLRLIESRYLQVDEASLTGESIPVDKNSEHHCQRDIPLGERLNMAYKSTLVTRGRGLGMVVSTGMETEIGCIAKMLHEKEPLTPLQQRLAVFGKKLSYLIFGICAVLFFIGIWQGGDVLDMLLVAISVAVAAIPEALPAVVTIALALGARRLVKKRALIRKLPAVETLGSVTYICSDKTGTITRNQMTVKETVLHPNTLSLSPHYTVLECAIVLNNDAKKARGEGQWIGDPMEIALMEFVGAKNGWDQLAAFNKEYPRVAEIPFDSDRKRMTTIHRFGARYLLISKGAIEVLAPKLDNHDLVEKINQHNHDFALRGMRVLLFSYRVLDKIPDSYRFEELEHELQFAGLVGMIDPPRPEVKSAIEQCKTAGIKPVMITGDHPVTARAIAQEIGIWSDESLLVTGKELQGFSSQQLDEKVEHITVYARVSPEQKLNIVRSLQRRNQFVAMTGDGVNDAPSLKIANIGVAMGLMGTEVSKEAADMILLDDNFATIVRTVKEGRHIFDNIRKFIKYTMTSNSGEIWTLFLAPLIGLPIPLLPIHILWINLVTDGLPGLALTMEPSEKDIMKRPPRPPNEPIFAHGMGRHILWVGLLMGLVCLGLQAWSIEKGIDSWQTMVFTVLCLSQLGHVLAIRSDSQFLYKQGLLSNANLFWTIVLTFVLQMGTIYLPFANKIFKTEPLSLSELLICLVASLVVFHAVELEKWIKSRRRGTVLPVIILLIVAGCSIGDSEVPCERTTRKFAENFNRQDFRRVATLFKPNILDHTQINRLTDNLLYIYAVAGEIRSMQFSGQEGSRITYISIHENTAMDITFLVDDHCRLQSYLINTHYPDSLPQLERNTTSIRLPFHGEWYVEWGGPTMEQNYHNAHRNMKGAFDFTKKDGNGNFYRNQGRKNEDYYAFGQEVIAPCRARVVKVVDGIDDNAVGRPNDLQTYGNLLVLETEEQEFLLLAHLQKQSIAVNEGQMVERGDLLARCGNSGYSNAPHLHFILQNVSDLFHPTGATCYFDSVEVNGLLRRDYSPVKGELVRSYGP